MTLLDSPAARAFGRNLVAMVTPMNPDGSLSRSGVERLVEHLVDGGCDGIVVAGTTGEAPTLTPGETTWLVRTVRDAVAGRARVTAGVGTNDTATTIERARAAEEAGADGLLLVCPYYSRPSQAGIVAHCRAVADATDLPVMLYDVPARTGTAMAGETLVDLAGHPRILAVKDAKGDLFEGTHVMARTGLAYYGGIDEISLASLATGAVGLVSVVANVVPDRTAALIAAVDAGDLARARTLAVELWALTDAVMRGAQGAVMAKAALAELGVIPSAAVRLPLVEAGTADLTGLRAALASALEPA